MKNTVEIPEELIEKFEASSFCPNDCIRGRPETGTSWNTLKTEYEPASHDHYSETFMYYVLNVVGEEPKEASRPWGSMGSKADGDFVKSVVEWFQSMTQAR